MKKKKEPESIEIKNTRKALAKGLQLLNDDRLVVSPKMCEAIERSVEVLKQRLIAAGKQP